MFFFQADPRLTLFVTHGGAGSLLESATHGKPVVVVPLFGDQTRNAKIAEKFGFGVLLDKRRMDESEVLRRAISKILNEPRYTQAAHRIRDLLAKRPFTPEQKLVRTVELAAEFGQLPELRVAGRDLNFVVYHNLDILVLFIVVFSLSIFSVLYCLRKLFRGTAYAIGAPVTPSFMPASQGVTDDSTSLPTRATNIFFTFLSWYFQTSLASSAETAMRKNLGPATPPIWSIVSNITWVLTNAEPLLEFAKPTLHTVVDIGGIGVGKPKPLDKKWNKILSLRSRTVLISFGSVAPSSFMPFPVKKAITEVAKSYPNITFIWKYEHPENVSFADGVKNLVLSRWTPQSDLLADPRLILFVTHGGAGSLFESATQGKPVVVVPLFGDQTRNAKIVTKFGFGVFVDKKRMGEREILRSAISKILSELSYTQAAHRIRDLLAKRPFTPEQKLVRTVELAAEFGQLPELRVAGRDLNFIFYYNLDILMLFIAVFSLFIFSILYCLKKLCRITVRITKVKEE
ncbi:UDP-glucoronosyl and UDP-glucosyl transferase [Oesophagostomum dentatum]|uniref:UDP-glucuronosyltransferase n=1 Tax=Oesophagostomum dentatum TaxID=61180 RepID=A0A0B1STX9_OESDE|nr:UDP-glucoronosyl and UDP-glucosyl transferase [Oesophagostomum dentatum]